MAKRLALVWALFLLAALAAFAGDVGQFVNLGFSADGKYFMFGQYGMLEKDSTPWADSFIVDVRANDFVAKGARHFAGTQPLDPGANGLGALLNLMRDSAAQIRQLKIDHLISGRLLYVLFDGAEASDQLEFRDFQSGRAYKIALTQSASPAGAAVSSSFSITITATEKDGTVKLFTAGNPGIKRAGVKAYHIKLITLSPDSSTLVFIVQREEQDTRGNNIRYMVETVRPK
jgi:predicted secreted protein